MKNILETEQRWQIDGRQIELNELLALLDIFDDYESFYKDYEELRSTIEYKADQKIFEAAIKTIKGEKYFGYRKVKKFINKHKTTIETLSKYKCLNKFTVEIYYLESQTKMKKEKLDYFYRYICQNLENIETMRAVIQKIKNLGITTICLVEDFDFTNTEYEFNRNQYCYDPVYFLENMEAVYSKDDFPIRYKSNKSNYAIELYRSSYAITFMPKKDKIILNTLLLDPNKLPNSVTFETTAKQLQLLYKEKEKTFSKIKDSASFSLIVGDLLKEYEKLTKVLERNGLIDEETQKLKRQLGSVIMAFSSLAEGYKMSVITSDSEVTEEEMIDVMKRIRERSY